MKRSEVRAVEMKILAQAERHYEDMRHRGNERQRNEAADYVRHCREKVAQVSRRAARCG